MLLLFLCCLLLSVLSLSFRIFFKRDDLLRLYPGGLSGNKSRKLSALHRRLFVKNHVAHSADLKRQSPIPPIRLLLSFGGTQSNALRALALLCAASRTVSPGVSKKEPPPAVQLGYLTPHIPPWLKTSPIGNFKEALNSGVCFLELPTDRYRYLLSPLLQDKEEEEAEEDKRGGGEDTIEIKERQWSRVDRRRERVLQALREARPFYAPAPVLPPPRPQKAEVESESSSGGLGKGSRDASESSVDVWKEVLERARKESGTEIASLKCSSPEREEAFEEEGVAGGTPARSIPRDTVILAGEVDGFERDEQSPEGEGGSSKSWLLLEEDVVAFLHQTQKGETKEEQWQLQHEKREGEEERDQTEEMEVVAAVSLLDSASPRLAVSMRPLDSSEEEEEKGRNEDAREGRYFSRNSRDSVLFVPQGAAGLLAEEGCRGLAEEVASWWKEEKRDRKRERERERESIQRQMEKAENEREAKRGRLDSEGEFKDVHATSSAATLLDGEDIDHLDFEREKRLFELEDPQNASSSSSSLGALGEGRKQCSQRERLTVVVPAGTGTTALFTARHLHRLFASSLPDNSPEKAVNKKKRRDPHTYQQSFPSTKGGSLKEHTCTQECSQIPEVVVVAIPSVHVSSEPLLDSSKAEAESQGLDESPPSGTHPPFPLPSECTSDRGAFSVSSQKRVEDIHAAPSEDRRSSEQNSGLGGGSKQSRPSASCRYLFEQMESLESRLREVSGVREEEGENETLDRMFEFPLVLDGFSFLSALASSGQSSVCVSQTHLHSRDDLHTPRADRQSCRSTVDELCEPSAKRLEEHQEFHPNSIRRSVGTAIEGRRAEGGLEEMNIPCGRVHLEGGDGETCRAQEEARHSVDRKFLTEAVEFRDARAEAAFLLSALKREGDSEGYHEASTSSASLPSEGVPKKTEFRGLSKGNSNSFRENGRRKAGRGQKRDEAGSRKSRGGFLESEFSFGSAGPFSFEIALRMQRKYGIPLDLLYGARAWGALLGVVLEAEGVLEIAGEEEVKSGGEDESVGPAVWQKEGGGSYRKLSSEEARSVFRSPESTVLYVHSGGTEGNDSLTRKARRQLGDKKWKNEWNVLLTNS
uniref:Uncharacterized protein n=1 Tax=Chromera velia CCMP2878 TaxID=1169474 RepID=A0A0G4HU72_9ALVE|eukprot:Cvel_31765.t1-p1 / transcript=Cvel_31765.t1 / gene=Cvel_31765 / organism=Chromera_velia_CCMP2878 / gene_product=hypothetical protein / transcript_product=hypothetical protein / location=Cvel_scaffold4793:1916-6071(+) / protein_length=1097 / sequence_SO=supercontig / SO=protein_coding / is_pseudo=false